MDTKAYANIQKLLIVGLIASIVTVLGGELTIGWVEYPRVENDLTGMMGMMLGSANLSLWQLACGVLFGGIGIPLQYYGFKATAQLVEKGGSKRAAKLIHVGAAATAGLGGKSIRTVMRPLALRDSSLLRVEWLLMLTKDFRGLLLR